MKINYDCTSNKYYLAAAQVDLNKYQIETWDIDETISELAYLTHDYFRYYGKFPSKVPMLIIRDLLSRSLIDANNDIILDNYEGSGTTLVEAKLAGFQSGGIDINPFAVLASNVKTANLDVNRLETLSNQILAGAMIARMNPPEVLAESIDTLCNDKELSKWWSGQAIFDIAILKTEILRLPNDEYRHFFDVCFFGILRRVSRAHDAEVRPHVNPKKKQRDVFEAYQKKIEEMIVTMGEWNRETKPAILSRSVIANNADSEMVQSAFADIIGASDKNIGLVVSHPPYLNCFDYLPVYKLEFLWADGFEEILGKYSLKQLKSMEVKSYPVDSDDAIERYVEHNIAVYREVYNQLRDGGYCVVVIGDCTVKGKLFSVHRLFIHFMEEIGFSTEKVVYRSTAYGMGKYAYKHRASYDTEDEGKKDAIIFFKK